MDEICLQLFHVLRYFASQSVKQHNKHGSIFDSRDRDSDRIIASWILYAFESGLIGKYKAFVDEYTTNYRDTEKTFARWCKTNNCNISNQFEETEKETYEAMRQNRTDIIEKK